MYFKVKCFVAFLIIAVFSSFSAFVFTTLYELKGIESLETYKPPIISKILDIKGRLISEFYKERRKIISLNDVSPYLIQATLSVEDKDFYSHYGIAPIRIIKALFVNLASLKKEQGGSTITVQLSKLIFLDHKKTFTRKIKELWYAFQIEAQYSKDEILNFYFNQINYGHGAYGVESAANFFFNKTSKNLSLAEAALLAAIPKSPVYYSPLRYPENAMRRHRVVFLAMIKNNYITEEVAFREYRNFWNTYKKKVKNLQNTFGKNSINQAPYFTEYIRARLERDFKRKSIYELGLNIYTTINLDHQISAQKHLWQNLEQQNKFDLKNKKRFANVLSFKNIESLGILGNIFGFEQLDYQGSFLKDQVKKEYESVNESLKIITGNLNLKNMVGLTYDDLEEVISSPKKGVQGAFISINPKNGYITAMIGGSPFSYNNQFNRAINMRRQIGSTLKPFIYAIAIQKDILTASTQLNDAPLVFGDYIPKNYNNRYRGKVLMRDALKKSINVLAVETLDKIGIKETRRQLAKIFGAISKKSQLEKFPNDLTMALGSGGFSPLSLATAYAVLANNGKEVIPKTIRYITDNNGELIKNYEEDYVKYEEEQLIDPQTVFIIKNIIKEVFSPGGTAYIPDLLKDFRNRNISFGKTGTTSNWKDAWFAGANSYLATVVWIGYDDDRSLGKSRYAGRVAAPVWINFQKEVLNNKPAIPFLLPSKIVRKSICKISGKLAGPGCPSKFVYKEFFKESNYPKEEDDSREREKADEERFLNNFFNENQSEEKNKILDKIYEINKKRSG